MRSEFLDKLSKMNPGEMDREIEKYFAKHNINLVNVQDEKGKTLAHYIAEVTLVCSYWAWRQQVLFKHKPDFKIQDKHGDTPMHIIARYSYDRATSQTFPEFVDYAVKQGFDFDNLLNGAGESVRSLAAQNNYESTNGGVFIYKTDNTKTIDNLQANKDSSKPVNSVQYNYSIFDELREDWEMVVKRFCPGSNSNNTLKK